MTKRRLITAGIFAGTATLLSSCGSIIYPERVNQKEHGGFDFLIMGMDAVGLLFFLVPGIVAFAVDFGTGAIYFPADHKKNERERTVFDRIDSQARLDRHEIERLVERRTGCSIELNEDRVLAKRLNHISEFNEACSSLSAQAMLASN
ncbi:polyribonucleotide nucleotidyltransferase [Pontiella sulfatireligans]|uniref:Uncharacterized protein n=1 Tax=Pontiella sulfatireligans TaxID=2750658 RepID=A0A6C2URZ9_9BACT|nr:polyribonucleotide nucleotidyltransferase [Pontiella sulfatireligans]VGO21706.1 hypothetical protein SCARR_03780 [Pontiella sulfatireligans]